jgi:nicotinamide mononucleotide (NMN) deamidase PncC
MNPVREDSVSRKLLKLHGLLSVDVQLEMCRDVRTKCNVLISISDSVE